MIYLSASAIKDFLSCERKYWYRRYASDLSEPSEFLARGNAVHKVIETYWDDPENGLFFLSTADMGSPFDLTRAEMNLKTFYNNFSTMLSEDDLIEHKFKIKYSDNVYLVGKFDRIITKTGVVIDWKTNRSVPRDISNDPQFILYYYAYTELCNSSPSAVYFASLTNGKLIRFNFEQVKLDILLNQIIPSIISNIENKIFNPTGLYRDRTCTYCPFKEHCHNKYLMLEKHDELDSKKFTFR